MKLRFSQGVIIAAVAASVSLPALAADQTRTQDQTKTQDQIRDQDIYGTQLMTQQERDAHRNKMRSAKTYEEQQRIRNEHHKQMQARARERGVTLPPEPPANRGPGMGPGPGGGGGKY
jgi:hypothetical protein